MLADEGVHLFPKCFMLREEGTSFRREGCAPMSPAAHAAFEEGNRGSLKVGKYADITVLSKDILKVPEDEILSAKVSYTIVGGKVLFKGK